MSIEDLALCVDTTVRVSARSRGELIALIEQDLAVIDAELVDALTRLRSVIKFAFDRHVLILLIARHAGAEVAAPDVCRSCGCSWNDACEDRGAGCAWATSAKDWCSACANAAVDAAAPPRSVPDFPTSAAA